MFKYFNGSRGLSSVITRAHAEALVDILLSEAHNKSYPLSDHPGLACLAKLGVDWSSEYKAHKASGDRSNDFMPTKRFGIGDDVEFYPGVSKGRIYSLAPLPNAYHACPKFAAAVDGLPHGWYSDVSYVIDERKKSEWLAANVAAVEAWAGPAPMKRRIMSAVACRGFRKPEAVRADLSGLKPVYGRSYTPAGGCDAKLKLKESVLVSYEQNSYSDDLLYLIPVEGDLGDAAICRSNLGLWCQAIRTHNGMAGSGCSYTTCLVVEPDGSYVELHCRSSISD